MKSDPKAQATNSSSSRRLYSVRLIAFALSTAFLALAFLAPAASAKEVIAYFGSEVGKGTRGGEFWFPTGMAVNSSGTGPANKGDIYVADAGGFEANNRIQRFHQNDNGTPSNPYDDKYEFVSAWGADVDSTPSGGSDYEICTVAADCQRAAGSSGNGTVAGDGVLYAIQGVAVDQDSGDVYVLNTSRPKCSFCAFFPEPRVNVYTGDGTFLRSFGYDVVQSGPDNAGTGYELCVAANGDVCKGGVPGSAPGQLGEEISRRPEGIAVTPPDGNPATGTVYVTDVVNHRIDTYGLDGTSPSNFGSAADFGSEAPAHIAVDSRGIVYADGYGTGVITRYDTLNANGGGAGSLSPIPAPPLSTTNTTASALAVDPDSDGAGPDKDVLYVLRGGGGPSDSAVQQFGPLNAPGLTAPPAAEDAEHGSVVGFRFPSGLGLDESSGRLFVSAFNEVAASPPVKSGVYVLDTAGGVPSASLESLSNITATTVTVHGTVNPSGPPDVSYRLEYSLDGSNWTPTPSALIGSQESPQPVEAILDPPPGGLEPSTFYHVRLAAIKPFVPPVVTAEKTFTTLAEAPQVETVGSPVRTATTAQLNGRIDPRNSASSYRFEYGSEGPCDANPCTATEPQPAGSGNLTELASEEIEGLAPNTTYHYRIVGESAAPGAPSHGEEMTVTTRASDAPLSHGHFPGPPGSDRAYEQVSVPDSGGNPVNSGVGFAEDGNRALYQINGGTPISTVGNFNNFYFSQRTPSGWQTSFLSPPREDLAGSRWEAVSFPSDISNLGADNHGGEGSPVHGLWRLRPDAPPVKLFENGPLQTYYLNNGLAGFIDIATESPRTIVPLKGGELDPAFPAEGAKGNLYDVSSATPKLVSLLPDGNPAACGIEGTTAVSAKAHPLAADGSHLFFGSPGNDCAAQSEIYLRDLEAEETKPVSGSLLSGSACGASLIRATEDAAFFWTQNRLDPADTVPGECGGSADGDVYRYEIATEALKCLTCVVPGIDADVFPGPNNVAREATAVAADGSRVYLQSTRALLPGAPGGGKRNLYVLEVGSGELRWVTSLAGAVSLESFGETPPGAAISHDGSSIRFLAKDASLNPLGGTADNGGTKQYYRYDDKDRSLLCVSCPQDGSAPVVEVIPSEGTDNALSDEGALIFATPNALLGADQNTPGPGRDPLAGTDVYEWRDGRVLLLTDGLTEWPVTKSGGEVPKAEHIDRSGRDAFFIAAAQYTPDALDGYARMYDARIGGGIEFPKPPPPCPLEVCQGTPKGAPEEQAPGTGTFSGAGNAQPRKNRAKKRHHRKKSHKAKHRANHNRRAHR